MSSARINTMFGFDGALPGAANTERVKIAANNTLNRMNMTPLSMSESRMFFFHPPQNVGIAAAAQELSGASRFVGPSGDRERPTGSLAHGVAGALLLPALLAILSRGHAHLARERGRKRE